MKRNFIIILAIGLTSRLFSQDPTGEKIDKLLKAYTETGRFNGSALVAFHNKILLENGYGYKNLKDSILNDSNTIFQIASVTKQFTSALILKLVELDKMSLTDKLSKYYPDYPGGDKITIENLLTHTSGIFNWTNSINFSPINEQTLLGFLKTKPLDFPPGTSWRYSNSNYSLLGYIIQKVSGMSYEDAIRKFIFIPLKMTHSGFDFKYLSNKDKATGYSIFNDSSKVEGILYDSVGPFAAGEIYSTIGDLFKWHKGLQSEFIISKTTQEKAYTPLMDHYGYGWIIDSLYKKRVVSHSGNISGFSSNLARIPEDDLFIILLNNKEASGLESITKNIMAVLYNQPYSLPVKRHPVKLDEGILSKYIGIYDLKTARGELSEVSIEKGKLILKSQGGPRLELIPEKENYFFDSYDDTEGDVQFVPDPNGRIDTIILSRNGESIAGKKIR